MLRLKELHDKQGTPPLTNLGLTSLRSRFTASPSQIFQIRPSLHLQPPLFSSLLAPTFSLAQSDRSPSSRFQPGASPTLLLPVTSPPATTRSNSSFSRPDSSHQMVGHRLVAFAAVFLSCLVVQSFASAGDADPSYRTCIEQCKETGCVGEKCISYCEVSLHNVSVEGPWYVQGLLYVQWKDQRCQSDCKYYCMTTRENEREALGHEPIKYHGKWPFRRVFGLQEPASVALSLLNLVMHIYGWLSLNALLHKKLPLKPNKRPFYEYTTLWHLYGILSINSWIWSAVFHSWDIDVTEKLDYSSAVALLGYSLLVAVLRSFSVRVEATRVMVAAPLIAFVTTHILFLNFYKLDYGWNMQVCVVMAVAQLLIWAIWAGMTNHPSKWKLWLVVFGGGLAMLLEIYDFPPYGGYMDAHALWHATTIPLTYLWWSFIHDDAKYRTFELNRKVKKQVNKRAIRASEEG
ncbi:hypothetical protein V2J09_018229 [Rumex salicifolius]